MDMSFFENVNIIIPSGATFVLSAGAYSEYEVAGVFRALKEIDPQKLVVDWLKKNPLQEKKYKFDADAFAKELFELGYFEHIPAFSWNLHEYSSVSAMEVDVSSSEWTVRA